MYLSPASAADLLRILGTTPSTATLYAAKMFFGFAYFALGLGSIDLLCVAT